MSRTKTFFYNSIATAINQFALMVAGFIIPSIMLKSYGSEINGLVSSISQFIGYFNLVEAGLSGAAIYALYKPLAENDYKGINGIISAAKKFYMQSGYIFVSLAIGLTFFYPFFVKTGVVSQLNVALLVLILGANGALEFFTLAKYRVLLSADQRTYVISVASIAHIITNTFIIFVFGTMKVNIVLLRLLALLSIFLRSFILMIYVKINYKFINYKEEPNIQALDKRWDVLYLQILGAVYFGAPVVILTLLTRDLKLVSVYTIFNMVASSINGLLGIFRNGLSASFGDVIARGETNVLQKAYREFEFSYYGLVAVVYSIVFVTIMPFIRIYTKSVNDISYDLPLIGFLFVLEGLLYNIITPQGMMVISAGLFKETKIPTTIHCAIVIVVGAILAPFFGIIGVLIGLILYDIFRDIYLLVFIPKNVTKLPVKESLMRIIRIAVSVLIICIPISLFNISPNNYISWAIYAAAAGIYAIIVVVVINLVFDKKEMQGTFRRVMRMVRR